MKTNSIQQEILLIAGTDFLSRQLTQEQDPVAQQGRTANDRLEEACWNGMLQLMLPEFFEPPLGIKNLFMWKVSGLESYIGVQLGDISADKDNELSIDPTIFFPSKLLS